MKLSAIMTMSIFFSELIMTKIHTHMFQTNNDQLKNTNQLILF